MKQVTRATAVALLLSIAGAGVYSAPVLAKPDQAKIEARKKAKTRIMGERTGKKVVKAFDAYNAEDIKGAIAILRELTPKDSFDKATVARYLGSFYAQEEDYTNAIKYLKQAVAPDVLNFNDHEQTLKLLGDLYANTKRYKDALNAYNAWIDFTGKEDAVVYTRIAQAHYELKQYKKVVAPADRAIKLYEKPNKAPYQLKMGTYVELKDFKAAVKVAEDMLKVWPEDKASWPRLGQFYMQVEDYKKGLSTMELAYKQGFLETATHYKILVSLYSLNDIPHKAAVIQEKALKEEIIKRDKTMVSALASYNHQAKNILKAAKYYGEAADFDNDAELYRKQGSLLLTSQRYSAAIAALQKSLDAGSEKKGRIYSDLAEAYFYQEKYKQAYAAIRKAMDDPKTRKFARGWSQYIKDTAARKGVKI